MKLRHAFGIAALCTMVISAPVRAEVVFSGSAAGCFGSGCTSYASLAVDSGLTYSGSSFSGTTLSDVLFVGTAPASPNVNNFGSFSLASTGNHDYSSDVFDLAVTFSQPAGTSPDPGLFTVDIAGKITGNGNNGSVGITWLKDTDTFSFDGGTFTLKLNDLSISPGGDVSITGTLTAVEAVPEPSTWAMMLLGFLGVGFLAYRGKAGPLRLA